MAEYVYLMGHTAMRSYYKIGRSSSSPYERAKQLSANSAVPHWFDVLCFIQVGDSAKEERYLHHYLADFRHSFAREFFRFAPVHMPWVWGLFEHHPRALSFTKGKRLMAYEGIFSDEVNPWAAVDDEGPQMTPYAPDYAYFDVEAT